MDLNPYEVDNDRYDTSDTTYLACKNRVCNLDTLFVSLLGGRTGIRHQLNNNRTWQTTNILAYDVDYTRVKIRKHPLFCKDHEASVYKQWPSVLCPWDVSVAVWEVES